MLNIVDEAIHVAGTQHIFKLWRLGEDDPEMAELYEELIPEIRAITIKTSEQEKQWTKHLFRDGTMLGLNEKILNGYIEHITDRRLAGIGLEPEFGNPKNPIPWINSWMTSDNVQVAPQETEITSYLTGGVDAAIEEDAFSGFKL